MSVDRFMEGVIAKNPEQKEFHQAVREVVESVWEFVQENPKYKEGKILERIVEPERVIIFRVPWVDDKGEVQVNRGFRIEFNSAIGPYKGGLRFHPSVNLSILKFLGFEQIFKNSLTTLPMGGGKGGCDFDPKGKSDNEVMRFCQSFMTELFRHIGPNTDVPAGDIGVGGREIGLPVRPVQAPAQRVHRRAHRQGPATGAVSLIRPGGHRLRLRLLRRGDAEAQQGRASRARSCAVSGSGNVAQYAIEKVTQLGAKVVTASDSDGCIYDPDGIDAEKLAFLMELKNVQARPHRGVRQEVQGRQVRAPASGPWGVKCDVALPCATQNELDGEERQGPGEERLQLRGRRRQHAQHAGGDRRLPERARCLYGPGKAANAGGVATSGLEMSQNSMRLSWTARGSGPAAAPDHEEHPRQPA